MVRPRGTSRSLGKRCYSLLGKCWKCKFSVLTESEMLGLEPPNV